MLSYSGTYLTTAYCWESTVLALILSQFVDTDTVMPGLGLTNNVLLAVRSDPLFLVEGETGVMKSDGNIFQVHDTGTAYTNVPTPQRALVFPPGCNAGSVPPLRRLHGGSSSETAGDGLE